MPSTTIELATLGHRIRHFRTAAGLTLDELGAAVRVAGSHLSLIENGKREPKLSLLQEIAAATGTQLAEIDQVSDIFSPRIILLLIALALTPWVLRWIARRLAGEGPA